MTGLIALRSRNANCVLVRSVAASASGRRLGSAEPAQHVPLMVLPAEEDGEHTHLPGRLVNLIVQNRTAWRRAPEVRHDLRDERADVRAPSEVLEVVPYAAQAGGGAIERLGSGVAQRLVRLEQVIEDQLKVTLAATRADDLIGRAPCAWRRS